MPAPVATAGSSRATHDKGGGAPMASDHENRDQYYARIREYQRRHTDNQPEPSQPGNKQRPPIEQGDGAALAVAIIAVVVVLVVLIGVMLSGVWWQA